MGQVMAARVLAAGHELTVYNRTVDKTAALAAQGAKTAGSVTEACRTGGPVLTMLADDGALKAVVQGDGGILASLPERGIHVAMGTHQIETIREIAKVHEHSGQVFVAAPVLGRPAVAAAGKLGVIAAGPAAALEVVQPLFDAIGRRTFAAGADQSAASLLKLCNNLILACAIEAMGEAFTLVGKSGVATNALREVLTDGLFNCIAYEGYSKQIVDHAWDQVNFAAALGLKDINLALKAAEAAQVSLPSANVCRDRLLNAIAHGDGQRDWTVMALEQARASGLKWG